jgi:hypothetical protein
MMTAVAGEEGQKRRVFLAAVGWAEVPVQPLHAQNQSGEIPGPTIIESPFTTIFVPQGSRAIRLASRTLMVEQ